MCFLRGRPTALVVFLVTACGSEEPQVVERTERDAFGLITCSEATPERTCFTHRFLMGISMGAHGAGEIGLSRPDLFDGVGMLGLPMVDWVYELRLLERSYLGGFCDKETILANLDRVNDPTGPAFCGPVAGTEPVFPGGTMIEPAQDFNHWYRWIDNGRGGSFGRNTLRAGFQDITLAFGNALSYNPESPYFAPGVGLEDRRRATLMRCMQPAVLRGFKHKEFNPDGTYDVIAACDTDTQTGDFDPDRPAQVPTEILLAVDYNGNHRRDYAEPILVMIHERFSDVGLDPNDRYDYDKNPNGKAGNWLHDEGESFEDTGLDGVPGTGDFGEGNGKFDYNPNVERYFALNPRMLLERMPEGHLDRLSIWADAGIRDFLFSALGMNWLWGSLQARLGKGLARDYTSFGALTPSAPQYDFLAVDYQREAIGQHVYVRYGHPDAAQREIERGDGHHVGTAEEVMNRFLTSIHFMQSRMYLRDVRESGEIEDVTKLIQRKTFHSASLNAERDYGIALPPGYDLPENAGRRYPVMYFMHGQGMTADRLLATALLFLGYMAGSSEPGRMAKRESDWAKFIMVFPDSTCEEDCRDGNFNANHAGFDGRGSRYMDSIFDLLAHIEANYKVLVPVEVPR